MSSSGRSVGSQPIAGSLIGAWYGASEISTGLNWSAQLGQPVGNLTLFPTFLEAGTLDRIGQQQVGAGTAGELARLGIYADTGRGFPGALLVDAGTLDLSTAAALKSLVINLPIARALYWLGLCRQGPSIVTTLTGVAGGNTPRPRGMMPATIAGSLFDAPNAFVVAGVAAGLPATGAAAVLLASGTSVTPPFVRYGA